MRSRNAGSVLFYSDRDIDGVHPLQRELKAKNRSCFARLLMGLYLRKGWLPYRQWPEQLNIGYKNCVVNLETSMPIPGDQKFDPDTYVDDRGRVGKAYCHRSQSRRQWKFLKPYRSRMLLVLLSISYQEYSPTMPNSFPIEFFDNRPDRYRWSWLPHRLAC